MLVKDAEPQSLAVDCAEACRLAIELRQQAHYWRAQHASAVQRESAANAEAQQLKQVVRDQQAQLAELTRQVEALSAKVAWLQRQVFGRKSEQTLEISDQACGKEEAPDAADSSSLQRRKRGKQPGTKGYGRKRRDDLPTEELFHDLPQVEQKCPRCGKPFTVFGGTEDSELIDWEVRLVRRIHRRTRYRPTCNCRVVPGIVTAPGPAKLIPKGMFSTGFWVRILLEKFLFQRPLYRVRQALARYHGNP